MKILIINAHPKKNSFVESLSKSYAKGAKEAGHKIKYLNLREIGLKKYFDFDHSKKLKLSPELEKAQKLITWADHLIFAYPIWWATAPALLKIFIEISFQSGFAFKYLPAKNGIPQWKKLLEKKSARLITSMDSPPIFYKLVYGDPSKKMMKTNLNFCGIKPIKTSYFGSVKMASKEQKRKWLKKIYQIGLKE
jgi:putative NADPH-quinone reductase